MPRSRLRAPALTIPTRFVRSALAPSTTAERARAFRVALPEDVVFSHVTACQLWDLPLPRRLEAQVDLDVMRAPVRSPMETRARLMFHRAGFPEPEVNGDAHGLEGGWLFEGDLVWRERRVVAEYQGKDHASIKRRSYDADRQGVAREEGWRVLGVYAEDVFRRPRRPACLRRFAQELGLDPAALTIT